MIHSHKLHKGMKTFEFTGDGEILNEYVDSLYTITTTISTVGYGDFKGFVDTDPVWSYEMLYLIFVTISGIMNFSSLSNQIFTYKCFLSVQEMVNKRVKEVEIYMYEISAVNPDMHLPIETITECKQHMEMHIRSSTIFHF